MQTIVEKTSGYSGEQIQGLNLKATYDRVYSIRNANHLDDIKHNFGSDRNAFQKSGRSRFNMELNVSQNMVLKISDNLAYFSPCNICSLINHSRGSTLEGFATVTLEYNLPKREVRNDGIRNIKKDLAKTLENKTFDKEIEIKNINKIRNQGYTFELSPSAEDIWSLREGVFDYRTLEKIQEELVSGDYYIAVIKDSNGIAVSTAMLSKIGGESSERSTHPKHQRKGLMQATLCVLHAHAINQGFNKTIRGDFKYDSSASVAAKTGFEMERIEPKDMLIKLNHVIVGEGIDPWNKEKKWMLEDKGDKLEAKHLKSFIVGSLKEKFTEGNAAEMILSAANV